MPLSTSRISRWLKEAGAAGGGLWVGSVTGSVGLAGMASDVVVRAELAIATPLVRGSQAVGAWHMPAELLTVGHSNHTIEHFIALLTRHGVTALGDVRSFPRSRFNPQFNRDRLEAALRDHAIGYVYLGD